jgi:hypothetical protein
VPYFSLKLFHPVAKSNDISHGIHAKSIDSTKAGGLQKTVFMSKSATVMLSVNLCVSFDNLQRNECHILASNYSIESFEANLHDKMLFCILLEQEELLLTVVDLVLVLLLVVN